MDLTGIHPVVGGHQHGHEGADDYDRAGDAATTTRAAAARAPVTGAVIPVPAPAAGLPVSLLPIYEAQDPVPSACDLRHTPTTPTLRAFGEVPPLSSSGDAPPRSGRPSPEEPIMGRGDAPPSGAGFSTIQCASWKTRTPHLDACPATRHAPIGRRSKAPLALTRTLPRTLPPTHPPEAPRPGCPGRCPGSG